MGWFEIIDNKASIDWTLLFDKKEMREKLVKLRLPLARKCNMG